MINRDVYQTPGKEEQWTISVQHSEDDIDLFVNVFGEYCDQLTH
jgi:glutamate-1-semialdehyde 2,1-aminomutase